MPSWHCSATSKIHTLAAAPLYEKEPASAASRRRQKRRGHSGPGATSHQAARSASYADKLL
jgi:hypothetical protein